MSADDTLTIPEMAAVARVSQGTVRRRVQRREEILPGVIGFLVGSQWRFSRARTEAALGGPIALDRAN